MSRNIHIIGFKLFGGLLYAVCNLLVGARKLQTGNAKESAPPCSSHCIKSASSCYAKQRRCSAIQVLQLLAPQTTALKTGALIEAAAPRATPPKAYFPNLKNFAVSVMLFLVLTPNCFVSALFSLEIWPLSSWFLRKKLGWLATFKRFDVKLKRFNVIFNSLYSCLHNLHVLALQLLYRSVLRRFLIGLLQHLLVFVDQREYLLML